MVNKDYYNRSPFGLIEPGDIFTNLPTMGLLKEDFVSGLIITPACDLANGKSETITYLPVVSIKSWLCSSSFYPELVPHFHSLWNQFDELCKSPLSKQLPENGLMDLIKEELKKVDISRLKGKKIEVYERIQTCLELVDNILDNKIVSQDYTKVQYALSKVIKQIIPKIVSNSFSTDMHFLPSEKFESSNAYILPEYSIVMFRFPITVPFDILDLAKDVNVDTSMTWNNFIKNSPDKVCYKSFGELPMRGLRLNQEYLSDLLTRYIGLYVRIGSPDFDSHTSDDIVQKIEEQLQN